MNTANAEHYVAQIHKQVSAQLFTLRLLLAHLLRPTTYGERPIARVGEETFY